MSYIKIETKKRPKTNLILGEIVDGVSDFTLEIIKESLIDRTKNTECDIHKSESKGTIIISLNNNEKSVEFIDFCCDHYKNQIEL